MHVCVWFIIRYLNILSKQIANYEQGKYYYAELLKLERISDMNHIILNEYLRLIIKLAT
jgi:hypothetical protein